jgi:hypothetical protein
MRYTGVSLPSQHMSQFGGKLQHPRYFHFEVHWSPSPARPAVSWNVVD